MSVTTMRRPVAYSGLSYTFTGAVKVANRLATRTGRRHRVHRVPVRWTHWGGRGWHICEVGTCRKDQA